MIGELSRKNDVTICYYNIGHRWSKMLYVCTLLRRCNFWPICICSDVFRRSSVDLMFAYVCLRCLLGKKAQKSRFTDCVLGKNAQSPRNLAFSVCRTTFPRFSDTSGGRATSTMDPSAARIWDPLRRSWPHTKPPCSAYTMYTLRMRELFLSRTQCTFQKSVFWLQYMYYIKFVETDFCLMIFFGYIHHLTVHRTESQKLCWNIINMQLHLKQFNQTVSSSSVPAHSKKFDWDTLIHSKVEQSVTGVLSMLAGSSFTS